MPGNKFRLALVVSSAVLLVAAPGAVARTYKWVDENGTTHYSDSKPFGRGAEELSVAAGAGPGAVDGDGCESLTCRVTRVELARIQRQRAVRQRRDAAAKATVAYPIFPTRVKETDDEKIMRLVTECKRSRGSNCDSDEEKRRMLLQNVDLTHQERGALRGLSPAVQRRVLLQRIPKQYRHIE